MSRLRYVVAAYLFVVVGLLPTVPGVQADDHPSRGDRGADVVAVQSTLRSYGYTVTVDGRFGSQTERAVRHWQRANGLVVDGVVGPVTRASLDLSPTTPATATAPARRVDPPTRSPEQIIRDVWADDLEDRAVAIAYRESRLVPTAANACCYGLFQIHYAAHRAWLGEYGVSTPTDLFDPTVNARVAYALYQSAGWDPWKL